MRLLRNEARRLRRKFLKKFARRTFDSHTFERWMDWQFAKSAIPLLPWFVFSYVEGQTATATTLLIVGAGLALSWFTFVFWNLLAVAARFQDKRYMLFTRKRLSR